EGLPGAAEMVVGERAREVAVEDTSREVVVARGVRVCGNYAGAQAERQHGRHRRCDEAENEKRMDVHASPTHGTPPIKRVVASERRPRGRDAWIYGTAYWICT